MTATTNQCAAEPSVKPSARITALDWPAIGAALNESGHAVIGPILSEDECAQMIVNYDDATLFRSRVVMAHHGFGCGEYKYFAYPLPDRVAELRAAFYPPLARIANRWNATLGVTERYPPLHREFLERCHAAGQVRPTPLLLRYATGDYNCLHRDVYGALLFPLQVTILLSAPVEDFSGGEFVLTEQRPRMQSRAEVVPLRRGEGVIFATDRRPVQGRRSVYRVTMRHGVSRLRRGQRFALGIIFHDAE